MYIIPGVGGQPDKLVWLSKDGVDETVLEAGQVPWRLAVARAPARARGDPEPTPEPTEVGGASRDPVIPLHDANPTRRTPVVTLAIIAACALVYGYQVCSWLKVANRRSRSS